MVVSTVFIFDFCVAADIKLDTVYIFDVVFLAELVDRYSGVQVSVVGYRYRILPYFLQSFYKLFRFDYAVIQREFRV